MLIEVCVDDARGLAAALDGGANRIELCAALALGGLTPSQGLMRAAAVAPVPAYAMIRPRAGDFQYSEQEVAVMLVDIAAARAAGLAGVVLGASLPDGRLDAQTLATLSAAAAGLGTTLHRAFDLVPDLREAVELAVALGFERILSSGRAPEVALGEKDLQMVQRLSDGRITVMPGAGVGVQTIPLLRRLQVREVHGSFSLAEPQAPELTSLGFGRADMRRTDAARIRAFRAALDGCAE